MTRYFKNGAMILSSHPLYGTWCAMKSRCYYPSDDKYSIYGARGITICEEWLSNPQKFFEWCDNQDIKKGYTIHRLDNSKGYSPENCEFADLSTQNYMRGLSIKNISGKTGVQKVTTRVSGEVRWRATFNSKPIGTFRSLEEAIKVREDFELLHYGFIKE